MREIEETMDSRLPLSAAAYRPPSPPNPAPTPMQPPPTPIDAYFDFTPADAWAPPFSSDLDATPSAAAMPPQSSKGCAACRFQHKKCQGDCLLAPFFPASEDSKFQKVRRFFGLSRIQKTLKRLLPEQRAVAMATMIYEAEVQAARPGSGCIDIILQLHSQIERKSALLALQHSAAVTPPAPCLATIGTGDGGVIPPLLQSNDTNSPIQSGAPAPSPISTGNHKRRCQDLSEEEMMRQRSRRRTSQN